MSLVNVMHYYIYLFISGQRLWVVLMAVWCLESSLEKVPKQNSYLNLF